MISRFASYLFEIRNRLQMALWNIMDTISNYHGKAIMFHNISNETIDTLESCQCKVDVFEQILLNHLANSKIISIDEMMDIIDNNRKENFTIITFDDIPENVYTTAFPILQKYEVPFAIFVSTEFVDKKGFITLEQLKTMAKCPLCTVGAHSSDHIMLRECDNIYEQLQDNKNFLENQTGLKVQYLAYPYGRHESVPNKAKVIARRLGFKCAFSTIPSLINQCSSKNRYFLPRIVQNKL